MKKRFWAIIFPLLILRQSVFCADPAPYRTISKSVENGYFKTVITYYTPAITYRHIPVLKNYYRGKVLYKRGIIYQRRRFITWRTRSVYKYVPLNR